MTRYTPPPWEQFDKALIEFRRASRELIRTSHGCLACRGRSRLCLLCGGRAWRRKTAQ